MPYTWPVTLAETKTDTNITSSAEDAEIQTFIDAATALLENHPAFRVKESAGSVSYTEWADAGNSTIVLKHYPVTTVTTIAEYTGATNNPIVHEPIDGGTFSGYGWDYEDGTGANGILVRLSNSGMVTRWLGNRVKIVYTAGPSAVPADLRLAALVMIEHLWETQRGGSGPTAPPGIDIDEAGRTFGHQFGPTYALPNRVRELLEPYRKDLKIG